MRIILTNEQKVKEKIGLVVEPVFIQAKEILPGFFGRSGQVYFQHHSLRPKLIVGLGQKNKLNLEKLRRLGAVIAVEAKKLRQTKIFLTLEFLAQQEEDKILVLVGALVEGLILADYQFLKYKTKEAKEVSLYGIKEASLILVDKLSRTKIKRQLNQIIKRSKTITAGVYLARDLVNEPASSLGPKDLVSQARQFGRQFKDIKVKIYSPIELKKAGLAGILAVAKGSDQPAYLIELKYEPRGASANIKILPKIALVGKGLTFDAGGISLKPAESMENMKIDMAGAASILGLFSILTILKPKANIYGILGVCENMPSGKAVKPGDIITAYNKKTIEIKNTDAEGRIVLADLLSYTESRLKPDVIIDLATLTGACVAALGEQIAGAFSKNKNLIRQIKVASQLSGERVWPMPMPADYQELIKSQIADLANISSRRWGGAITAALFLKQFIKSTPWLHLDIAGPAWEEVGVNPYIPKGATGFGVRLLAEFVRLNENENNI